MWSPKRRLIIVIYLFGIFLSHELGRNTKKKFVDIRVFCVCVCEKQGDRRPIENANRQCNVKKKSSLVTNCPLTDDIVLVDALFFEICFLLLWFTRVLLSPYLFFFFFSFSFHRFFFCQFFPSQTHFLVTFFPFFFYFIKKFYFYKKTLFFLL